MGEKKGSKPNHDGVQGVLTHGYSVADLPKGRRLPGRLCRQVFAMIDDLTTDDQNRGKTLVTACFESKPSTDLNLSEL
jgi:hypothetical protein